MKFHNKNNFQRRMSEEQQQLVIMSEPATATLGGLSLDTSMTDSDPRSIWFTSEVYPETVAQAIQQITAINYADDQKEKQYTLDDQTYVRHPIKLYISSYGGSVYDGLGLVGVIRSSKTPVHTISIGKVMSMGFILALSGHRRFAYPHTSYMFHSLSSVHWGKFSELQESVQEDTRLQAKLDLLTTSLTTITQERLNEVHEKKLDWYLDAEEALALGCFDELI